MKIGDMVEVTLVGELRKVTDSQFGVTYSIAGLGDSVDYSIVENPNKIRVVKASEDV